MSDLITKIRNAVAWDEKKVRLIADMEKSYNFNIKDTNDFVFGCSHQHAQTQWLVEALEIALAALDEYAIICGGMESMFENTPTKRAKAKVAALVPKREK